jgi:GTP-binding protein Era
VSRETRQVHFFQFSIFNFQFRRITMTQTHFGIVALVGRPNAGKSTLLNRILGQKVSIVSPKPQTTRNRIVGILNDERGQIALLDTPGIHRPLHKLNVRMMDHVRSSLSEADVIALIVDASEPFGKGDQFVIDLVREEKERNPGAKRFVILNKIDLLKKEKLLPLMQQYHGFGLFDEIVPISAAKGEAVDELVALLFRNMPEGEAVYPQGDYTTQPERFFAAEIVREKVLQHTSEELPYTTAVSVDRYEEDEETNFITIFATIFVERDSQKPIVIGKRGAMIKLIGTEARVELESILGAKVFLDLHVSVHDRWREDERFLGELEWPLG